MGRFRCRRAQQRIRCSNTARRRGTVSHRDIPYYNEFDFTYGQDFGGDIDVIEGFAEVNLPLLRGKPFANLLELNTAIRRTRNEAADKDPDPFTGLPRDKSVDITSWKVSAIWDPLDWLRVRATRSRDIRAPGFRELFFKTVPTEVGSVAGVVTNPWQVSASRRHADAERR